MALSAVPCAAEVRVSLPLEGYYRVGRYMPVRVVLIGEPGGKALTLSAGGAVTTTLGLNGPASDVVAPLLVVTEPLGPVTWSLPDGRKGTVATKLTALGEQDRLVGFAGGDAGAAAPLFPGKTVIPVPLDLVEPLHNHIAAWETLDAAVMDRFPADRAVQYLAVGGTAIVTRAEARPEADVLPWRRVGDAWVLSNEPLGPRGAIVPEAYDPTYGWRPGRTPAVRRQVVLTAVLVSVLVVAATLWRSRLAVALVVGLCGAACGAIAFRASRLSPVVLARGGVFVRRGEAAQSDRWEFFKSMAPAVAEYHPALMARPVFASAQHFQRAGLHLWCGPDAEPLVFTFPLAQGASMVFLTRRAVGRPGLQPDAGARGSPLWPLVREGYLRPGVRAAGEVSEPPPEESTVGQELWPGVVVDGQ